MNAERVIVVGAGLAGLAVAMRLRLAGRDVLVLEEAGRAGGQIQTFREPGLVVELGAEGFVARSRAVPALCGVLAIEDALVDQLTTDTYRIEDGELLLLPPGEAARRLGFQVPEEELGRGIRSLQLGMGQLVDALVESVGSERVRCATGVSGVRREGNALAVELADGSVETGAVVVLAAPSRVAAKLLTPLGLAEALPLGAASLTSNVSVNLLYRREHLQRYPAGSGLIFPEQWGHVGLRALSIVEHKFAGRAPAGQSLLRVFFRPVADALTTWSDEKFSATAESAIEQVLGATGAPQRGWVSRWADALPVFTPAHRAAVAALDQSLQALNVHVAGSAFHGAGIDAAVQSAEIVAARLAG